jgi:DNA replication protein DnaC
MNNTEIDFERIGHILTNQQSPKNLPKVQHDYSKVKKLYWMAFNQATREKGRIDGNMKSVFRNLVGYVAGDHSYEWPLQKGLFFFGPPGVGKTLMLEVANRVLMHLNKDRAFKVYSADKIALDVDKDGREGLYRFSTQPALIDDIGIEPPIVRCFGTELAPIETIVYERYVRYRNSGLITHFTSNLGPEEIEEQYGTRGYSRLCEMATFVFCDSTDKRIENVIRSIS